MFGDDEYLGEIKNGKRDGRGAIVYKDGSSYDGDWANDQRHGYGVLMNDA